jgi:hypothetical protein
VRPGRRRQRAGGRLARSCIDAAEVGNPDVPLGLLSQTTILVVSRPPATTSARLSARSVRLTGCRATTSWTLPERQHAPEWPLAHQRAERHDLRAARLDRQRHYSASSATVKKITEQDVMATPLSQSQGACVTVGTVGQIDNFELHGVRVAYYEKEPVMSACRSTRSISRCAATSRTAWIASRVCRAARSRAPLR